MRLTASALNRPCPACGNARAQGTRVMYRIREFDVLECLECAATFINLPVKNEIGFGTEYGHDVDPLLADKASSDLQVVEALLRNFAPAITEKPHLLDVGCGIGTFLLNAQRAGWNVSGIEMNPGAAEFARDGRGLDVACGSAEQGTSYPSASYDVVTMWGVIEHMASPAAAVGECARVLTEGGFLVVQTPCGDGMIRRVGLLLYRLSRGVIRFQVKEFYQTGGGHSVIFGRQSAEHLLNRAGFKVMSIRPSTYGLRILLKRFQNANRAAKLVKSAGTVALFVLGRALRAENHMTVVARKVSGAG